MVDIIRLLDEEPGIVARIPEGKCVDKYLMKVIGRGMEEDVEGWFVAEKDYQDILQKRNPKKMIAMRKIEK